MCDELNKHIEEIAREATSKAYKKSLSLGNTIITRKKDNLVEINKYGVCRVIKKLPSLVFAKKGTKFRTG